MSNTDAPDSTMSLRGRIASSTGWFVGFTAATMIVIPFLLIKQEADTFNATLPLVMAGGMVFAGLWGVAGTYLPDPVSGEVVAGRHRKAGVMLLVTLGVAVLTWAVATAVTTAGSGWASYDVLKSGGWLTYVAFGLLPVIAYFILMKAMASRRIVTSPWWTIASVVCLAISMLAPWFWAGFKTYADYHTL